MFWSRKDNEKGEKSKRENSLSWKTSKRRQDGRTKIYWITSARLEGGKVEAALGKD